MCSPSGELLQDRQRLRRPTDELLHDRRNRLNHPDFLQLLPRHVLLYSLMAHKVHRRFLRIHRSRRSRRRTVGHVVPDDGRAVHIQEGRPAAGSCC